MSNLQLRPRGVPAGLPTPEDLELVHAEMPRIRGGEMLVRTRWLALEREALRAARPGMPVPARAVADVVESRHDIFSIGDHVVLETGLQQYCASDGVGVYTLHAGQNPPSTALGALGAPGMLAYFGLLDAAKLAPRETVLVADAGSAAGLMAGQIAQLREARAIGLARSREVCAWLVRSARFAACIDAGTEDVPARLRALAPGSVDLCFDAGDGQWLETLAAGGHFSRRARIVSCAPEREPAPPVPLLHVTARHYEPRREEYLREAIAWFESGLIVHREDAVEGLQSAAAHLCRVARGETFGAALVRVT